MTAEPVTRVVGFAFECGSNCHIVLPHSWLGRRVFSMLKEDFDYEYLYCMTSEIRGNVPNPFLNLMGLWQNYLIYWIEVNRNFYENAIKTNEQWLKTIWYPWLSRGSPEQRKTVKVE